MKRALVAVAVIALVSAGWALAQSKPSGAADANKPAAPPAASAAGSPAPPAAPAAGSPAPPAAPAAGSPAPPAASAAGSPTLPAASAAGSNKPTSQAEAFRQAQARARTQQALAGKPKLEFTDTPLKAVLDYLAEIGHFSIVYDKALEEAGIDLAAIPVSITASGLSYENAIRLLLPKECGYRIEAGYVLVTTLEKSWTPLTTVSYSIQVTMAQIPDFGGQAPRFQIENLGSLAGKAGGGGAATLFGAAPAKEEAVTPPSPDRIIEFVKKFACHANDRQIAPWDDEGGPATIQYLSGHLIISQTEFGHRAVARLLAMIE
jgi:hypothetical protein